MVLGYSEDLSWEDQVWVLAICMYVYKEKQCLVSGSGFGLSLTLSDSPDLARDGSIDFHTKTTRRGETQGQFDHFWSVLSKTGPEFEPTTCEIISIYHYQLFSF